MLKRTLLTFSLVAISFYFYQISIEKSLIAGLIVSICVRNQTLRRIYENLCVLAIIFKLADPNIESRLLTLGAKFF